MLCILPDGFKTETGLIYDQAKVGELTGKQQNYLMDIKNIQAGLHHVNKILEELVLSFSTQEGNQYQGSIKSALAKISINDVETLLVKIRQNTFGDIFYMKSQCPNCEVKNDLKLDLNSLQITRSNNEDKDKLVELTLPKSGRKATIKLMGLGSISRLFSIFQKQQSELATATSSVAITSLDGKQNPTSEDVMGLSVLDIKYINDEYNKLGGKIDTNITHECKECRKDFDTKLNVVDPSFFFPS